MNLFPKPSPDFTHMKAVVLAGGFGTRLKEDGIHLPKGLISYKNTTLIDHVVDEIRKSGISDIAVVVNQKYYLDYETWNRQKHKPLLLVNDGINDPNHRLGALGDLLYACTKLSWEQSDILVVPSDTYFEFPLKDFLSFSTSHPSSFSTVVSKMDKQMIKNRLGCAVLDKQNRITGFEEKPDIPLSAYAAIPFYYYPSSVLGHLKRYQLSGNSMDAPGSIIPWLLREHVPVFGYITKRKTIDVGTQIDISRLKSISHKWGMPWQ